jgi:hypothetical protein
MLDLAQSDKFTDAATVAVRTAEAENEKLYEVEDAEDLSPVEFENHILHWKIHSRQMQEFRFKYKTSKEIQERFKDHVLAHEMFMSEQAKKSPAFAEQLKTLPMYPMFYIEPVMMPPMAPEMAAPMPQPVSQGLPGMPELPVSPLVGGEGIPAIEPQPNLEMQTQGGPVPPVEPTKGI